MRPTKPPESLLLVIVPLYELELIVRLSYDKPTRPPLSKSPVIVIEEWTFERVVLCTILTKLPASLPFRLPDAIVKFLIVAPEVCSNSASPMILMFLMVWFCPSKVPVKTEPILLNVVPLQSIFVTIT